MKLGMIATAMISTLQSCTENENEPSIGGTTIASDDSSLFRNEQEAIDMAYDAYKMFYGSSQESRSENILSSSPNVFVKYTTNPSRSGNEEEPLYYVVNFANNAGYSIIPANKKINNVLAITECGNLDEDMDADGNYGLQLFLDGIESDIQKLIKPNPNFPPFKEQKTECTTTYDSVSPKLDLKWSQNRYPGKFCSNGIAGCAPLAIAMCMTYLEYPSSIKYSYSGRDINSESINWEKVKAHSPCTGASGCNIDMATHNTVARLCREIGEKCNADYSNPKKTSVPSGKIVPGARKILGSSRVGDLTSYKVDDVLPAIKNGLVILIGLHPETDEGHAWIADGYNKTTVKTDTYVRDMGQLNWTYISTSITDYIYVHYEWGMGGLNNGYFYWSSFNANDAYSYDSYVSSDVASHDYSDNVRYIAIK